jgi:hypothetical protein
MIMQRTGAVDCHALHSRTSISTDSESIQQLLVAHYLCISASKTTLLLLTDDPNALLCTLLQRYPVLRCYCNSNTPA